MALVVNDRVQETCAAPGTGVVTLLGAVTQYQSFSAGIGANNTTYYTIADQTGSNWEVGLGTIGATGLTLTRTTVLASSNAGSIVNFSVGTQNIWCDYPASKAVYGTGTTLVAPTGTLLPVANGGTNLGGATPYTANGVMYASSTSALATSSALTFNGTTLNSATLALTSTSAGALVDIATITNASNTTNTETGIFFAPTTTTGNIRGARISAYQVTGNNDIAIKIYTGNGATISAGTIHWPTGGVSIGNTTDPGATNLSVTGSTTSASFIPSSATVPTNGVYLPAANSVGIATASTNAVYIDASQNVGIGLAPAVKLDILGSATTQLRVRMSGQADTRLIADTGVGRVGTYTNHPFYIVTNSTTAGYFDVSGNLNITGTVTGTQLISNIAIGTAPLVVTSTTNVPNLNASSLSGATFAAPGAIGSTTASTGAFTTLSATGVLTASAGTSALPSIVTSSGSTTGLYSSTANVLGVAVSATSIGTFTSTGLNGMAVGATTASTGRFTGTTITAGTTTIAPLKYTSGTNLTTAVAGSTEYNGTIQTFTPLGTQRGIVPAEQFFALNAGLAGANATGAQNIFGVGVTLSASTQYEFEISFALQKAAGTTSHTISTGFGGTATLNTIGFNCITGIDLTSSTDLTPTVRDLYIITSLTVQTSAISSATSFFTVLMKGIVSINAGGTFIPQYTLSAAPGGAYTTAAGSYMKIKPIGVSGANVNVGTWA